MGIIVCLFVNIKGLSIRATRPVQRFSNIIRVQRALSNLSLIDLLCSIKQFQEFRVFICCALDERTIAST